MTIWNRPIPIDKANDLAKTYAAGSLGIEFIEAGDDYVRARMPVDERTKQPAGLLHGGASVLLAETLASWAAQYVVDAAKYSCVGLEINANHVRAATDGWVYGTARPLHIGRGTQIWETRITDEQDRLVCVSRMTVAVLDRPAGYNPA